MHSLPIAGILQVITSSIILLTIMARLLIAGILHVIVTYLLYLVDREEFQRAIRSQKYKELFDFLDVLLIFCVGITFRLAKNRSRNHLPDGNRSNDLRVRTRSRHRRCPR